MAPVNGPLFAGAGSERGLGRACPIAGRSARGGGVGGVPIKCATGVTRGVLGICSGQTEPQIFFPAEKVCSRCGISKPRTLDMFPSDGRRKDGLRADCRACFSAVRLANYAKRRGASYVPSPAHKGVIRPRRDGGYVVQTLESAAVQRLRYRSAPAARMVKRLRERVRAALGPIPKGHYSLGCTPAELRVHIERQFLKGMSWSNRADWHIDHIRPLASFDLTDPEQLRAACHFSNLRPLWAEDNMRKGATLEVLI